MLFLNSQRLGSATAWRLQADILPDLLSRFMVTNLLALDDFAHTSVFNFRDMDKCVRASIVRLNEAEAAGGIKPFNCASGHDEPLIAKLSDHGAKARWMTKAIFERKVRSGRNAKCAISKPSKQISALL
jgi:hypothetical protein